MSGKAAFLGSAAPAQPVAVQTVWRNDVFSCSMQPAPMELRKRLAVALPVKASAAHDVLSGERWRKALAGWRFTRDGVRVAAPLGWLSAEILRRIDDAGKTSVEELVRQMGMADAPLRNNVNRLRTDGLVEYAGAAPRSGRRIAGAVFAAYSLTPKGRERLAKYRAAGLLDVVGVKE